MTVNRTPVNAAIRFINGNNTVQTLSRVNASLTGEQLTALKTAINGIRRTDQAISRGNYTVRDELTTA
ncbi:MAG: hypothetical protein FWE27_02485 [Defluviitaleaceae bacterium]|nr:hypothetical protein [Defluviitaleaceae bacterium]